MTKRLLLIATGTALAFSFTACGSSSSTPTPPPTPTPPTKAQVTFFLDPPTVTANDEGGDQFAFKVNLGFNESAGVGFTINTIENIITTSGGTVVLDQTYVSGHHVAGLGSYVVQSTVRYHGAGGRVPLVTKFVANIADDKGNAITATAQVNVLQNGQPQRLP